MKYTILIKFENGLKVICKKYRIDADTFLRDLLNSIIKNPKENSVIIAETESYQIVKRRVKNPKIQKGKSHGFRVWYCLKENGIFFCLIEDTSEKDKEKNTQQHIARIQEIMKEENHAH